MSDNPIAVNLDEFLNLPIEEKPPLLGTEGQAAIVAGGLILLGGQAGLGKTTLIVDAIFHLASGLDWLTFKVGRPLNILVIENEGPLRMFQQKLAAKRKVWQHPLHGRIHIQTAAWGWFSFAELDHHTRIKDYLEEHQVDLVIGDPIGTLGMEGVGSPEDTRTFVRLLVPLGLFDTRSFWFPVHFTKEPRKDEINQISGAWGGHLDTLMVLKATRRKDELRLSFPKLRWWNAAPPAPLILGKVYNTQSFEVLRFEGDAEPLEERITDLLSHGQWLTVAEIASKETGIDGGARRDDVKKVLEARTEMFRWEGGGAHGRSARAIVWQLVPDHGTSKTAETAQQSQTKLVPDHGTSRDESDESNPALLVPASGTSRDEYENTHPPDKAENSSQTPALKGALGTSTQTDTTPRVPANGTSNGETPARLHEQTAYIEAEGWTTDDLETQLLTRWPMLHAHDLETLTTLADTIAARELGT